MKNSVVKNSVVKNLVGETISRWKFSIVKSAVGEKYGGEMRHAKSATVNTKKVREIHEYL